MKRLTMLLTTAAAALLVTAAIGATAASAGTVLCAQPVTTCASGDIQPAGTNLFTGQLAGGEFALKTTKGETFFTCSAGSIYPKTTRKNGNPLTAEFESGMNGYGGNCTTPMYGSNACTTLSANHPPTTIEATKDGGGTVKIGSASQPLTLTYLCKHPEYGLADSTCVYTANDTVTMTIDGINETAKISGALMKKTSGGLLQCYGDLYLNVSYSLNFNAPVYISSARETVLCATFGYPCANGNVQPAGSILATAKSPAENSLVLKRDSKTVQLNCGNAVFSFETTQEAGEPLAAKTITNNPAQGAGCEAYKSGPKTCSSVEMGTPGATLESSGGENGVIHVGSKATPFTLSMTCSAGAESFTCTYAANDTMNLQITPESAVAKEVPMTRTSYKGLGIYCGTNVTLTIENGVSGFLSYI